MQRQSVCRCVQAHVRVMSPAFADAPMARLLEQAWWQACAPAASYIAAAGYTVSFDERRSGDNSSAPYSEGLFLSFQGPAPAMSSVVAAVFQGLVALVTALAADGDGDEAAQEAALAVPLPSPVGADSGAGSADTGAALPRERRPSGIVWQLP
jgi:hypothetical protein